MIFVTGDIHGSIDINKISKAHFPESKAMTKDDYLIICGDFGLVWDYCGENKEEAYWLDWLENHSFTTLFVDGNHECFPRLHALPQKEWNGGNVHVVREHVLHLMRGQVFNIDGKIFFTMGGASSHDRGPLVGNTEEVIGKYWWKEEIPSVEEMQEGLMNLQKHGGEVDYIITHCLPSDLQKRYSQGRYRRDLLTDYLMYIKMKVKYRHWYCGHYHTDLDLVDDVTVLYDEIRQIEA